MVMKPSVSNRCPFVSFVLICIEVACDVIQEVVIVTNRHWVNVSVFEFAQLTAPSVAIDNSYRLKKTQYDVCMRKLPFQCWKPRGKSAHSFQIRRQIAIFLLWGTFWPISMPKSAIERMKWHEVYFFGWFLPRQQIDVSNNANEIK